MKEIIEKITSYNLFNYLFPGIVFSVLITEITSYSLYFDNLILGLFVYYFVGIIISRFGSLLIEPILEAIAFVKKASYSDFLSASEKDPKIDILSQENNMYRTLISMCTLLGLTTIYQWIEMRCSILKDNSHYLLIILLIVCFLFAYRKQTNFIVRRVNHKK